MKGCIIEIHSITNRVERRKKSTLSIYYQDSIQIPRWILLMNSITFLLTRTYTILSPFCCCRHPHVSFPSKPSSFISFLTHFFRRMQSVYSISFYVFPICPYTSLHFISLFSFFHHFFVQLILRRVPPFPCFYSVSFSSFDFLTISFSIYSESDNNNNINSKYTGSARKINKNNKKNINLIFHLANFFHLVCTVYCDVLCCGVYTIWISYEMVDLNRPPTTSTFPNSMVDNYYIAFFHHPLPNMPI